MVVLLLCTFIICEYRSNVLQEQIRQDMGLSNMRAACGRKTMQLPSVACPTDRISVAKVHFICTTIHKTSRKEEATTT